MLYTQIQLFLIPIYDFYSLQICPIQLPLLAVIHDAAICTTLLFLFSTWHLVLVRVL